MSGIKIPVSADLNQQDIGQQINQVKAALNDLGRVAEDAGRAKFSPISKLSLDDVKKMRAEFEAMVRIAPGLKKALSDGGQGGRSFDKVEWGSVWKDPEQRGSHAATMLRYLRPDSVEMTAPGNGGRGRNGQSDPSVPGPNQQFNSPGTQPGWKRAASGAAAGLAGGVASQVGGLGGGIASGALAGGLAGGAIGAGIGGIMGGLTSILGSIGEARDLAISFDTLKRTLGDVGVSFTQLRDNSRGLADQYALSDTEASALMKRYATIAGGSMSPNDLRDEAGVGVGFSRSFGLAPSMGVDFFAQMKGLGVTKDANDNKRLALMIGESVAKAGDLPRMGDVMAGLSRYIEGATRTSLSSPGTNEWLARMAGLENTGLAGINPTSAANIIGTIDNTIRQGGNSEAGRNFMSGVLQREKALNPIQAAIQLEGGAFGSGKAAFGPDSPMAAFYSKFGGGTRYQSWGDKDSTVSVLQKQLIEQYSGKSPDLMIDAFKNTFGTSYGQSAAWMTSRPEDNDKMIARLQRLGINPRDVSGTGISQLSQVESDSSLSESEKDIKTRELASKNQEDTEGSRARETAEAGANAMRRLADEGLPVLTSIQAAVLKMAGIDPAANAREAMLSQANEAHIARRNAIMSAQGKAKLDAQSEYENLTPFLRRLTGAKLDPEQQKAKDKRDATQAAFDAALQAEKERFASEKTAIASAKAPESAVATTVPTPGTSTGVNGATPELLARAAESDRKAGLPPGTTAALMMVESSFNSDSVSKVGAQGLFQVMPENTANLSKQAGRQLNPHNTDDAFYMYDKLMEERRKKYGGDTDKMLRSYHGGYDESNWGPQNRDYLPAIEKRKRELAANGQGPQGTHYNMPQTVSHAVTVDVTMRDNEGSRMDNAAINTAVGRPVVSGGPKVL